MGLCIVLFTYQILSGWSHLGYLHSPLKHTDLDHHPMESGLPTTIKLKATCIFRINGIDWLYKQLIDTISFDRFRLIDYLFKSLIRLWYFIQHLVFLELIHVFVEKFNLSPKNIPNWNIYMFNGISRGFTCILIIKEILHLWIVSDFRRKQILFTCIFQIKHA